MDTTKRIKEMATNAIKSLTELKESTSSSTRRGEKKCCIFGGPGFFSMQTRRGAGGTAAVGNFLINLSAAEGAGNGLTDMHRVSASQKEFSSLVK